MATPGINIVGMTMLLQFVVSFGFILVVNAPQNMVAYGTETFNARDFVRTGFVLTISRSRWSCCSAPPTGAGSATSDEGVGSWRALP